MTERELSKYYKLKIEIADLEDRIKEFGAGVGSIKINDEIKATSKINSSVQEKYVLLKEKYMSKRIEALEEYIKIENYISTIDDAEIRTFMRKRYLDLKRWDEIGKEYNYDRTTVSKKVRNYIKNQLSHNSHQSVR